MADEIIITCDDIRKKLKPFQQDLLAEREYKAFVSHLDKCSKCKEYIGSIDFLSNQLWKLGDVPVPSDLSSTILFKLNQPDEEAQPSKYVITKKKAIIGIVVILLGVAVFFGIKHFRKDSSAQEIEDTPDVKVEEVKKEEPKDDRKMYFEDTVILAEADAPVREASPSPRISSDKVEVRIVNPSPLHWHFICLTENSRKESERKAKLLNVLNAVDVRLDHQASDVFTLHATGEKVDNILEQVLTASLRAFSFSDFSAEVATFADKEHSVSIYLEESRSSVLHWHVGFTSSYQKSQLLDVIKEKAGSIDYETEKIVVFSIQKSEITKLKTRIMAMRGELSEFGYQELKENQLASGPVKMSVYFTK